MSIDLSKLTEMELLDLRKQVNDELIDYENRNKTKVYTVFIELIGTKYFINKEVAISYLKDCIDEDMLFDGNNATCGIKYLTDAEVENYCQDYQIKYEP